MDRLRRWLLSPQCQLTVQLSVALLLSSLCTLLSPIHFSHACLVPVFVIVIVGSLAADQHIGTRLQVCAWMLGPCWLAAILAGSLMSLAKLAAWGQPQYVAATAVLALLGLALLVFLQAVSPPGPGRVMGILAVLIYGIMVTLSTLYPDLSSMWVGAVVMLVLGMAVAAVVAMLVGFLVVPSLASDEVWRLTSEALQGAGAVLSYHTSLLMVDEPSGAATNTAAAKDAAVPTAGAAAGEQRQGSGQQQRQPQQQRQQPEWHMHKPEWASPHHGTRHAPPTRRSSIEVAAAGAAVAAASQDAHKPAAEAAAVALSWVDTADEALSAAGLPDVSSARSEHSSARSSISSWLGSDAVADAAAENSKRLHTEQEGDEAEQEQQHNQGGQQGQAARQPRLSEHLLQLADQEQRQQQQGVLAAAQGAGAVDAWVVAAAAAASAYASDAVSTASSFSDISTHGLRSAVPTPSRRRSLEGAASLDFMEELDDNAFLQMMRVLSHSKGSTVRRPAGADAAAKPTADGSAAAAQPAAGPTGLPLSKSVGALSALSVAGSGAGEDWGRAVLPQGQLGPLAHKGAAGLGSVASHAAVLPPAASSVAGSVLSSHASVLHPASQQAKQQQQQQQQQHQQPSRLAMQQQQQQQPTTGPQPQQQPASSFSRRHSFGARAWSFLTQGSAVFVVTAVKPSPLQGKASASTLSEPPAADAGDGVMPRPLLPPPTTSAQLQPLIGRAVVALASARLEPWWLRPKSLQHFDPDACMKLLDACELLLVRLSTLEGVSEERSLMGLHLHQLAHYKGISDALALITAQLTAFIMHVATAVAGQETSTIQGSKPWRLHWLGAKPAAPTARRGRQPALAEPGKTPGAGAAAAAAAPARPGQRVSPFASAPAVEVGPGADADAASLGLSALLSNMERAGSGVSSYLWEKKTGWGQAREMLKREMDASLGSYWWSVRKASKQLPVKVPRSREVMVLIFLWPICNGLLEACERVEAAAQQVLRPAGAPHSTACKHDPPASAAVSWRSVLPAWQRLLSPHGAAKHQAAAASRPPAPSRGPVGASCERQGRRCSLWQGCMARVGSGAGAAWCWVRRQGQWVGPLLQLVLVKPALLAVSQAITQDVPKALSSRQGLQQMLAARTFQSGVKLLASTGIVLVATVLLMAYVPAVAHSVPIFGYAAVVLCFQPRVEATIDQAARRVLGTILGACLGLATNSVPGIFHQPLLLLACLAVASVVLGVLARPQRRTAIVLALLTLCAVSLCGYEAFCCSPRGAMSPVDTFLARMGSVCGACIFVALFNRLVLPWFTSDYALEQLADALEQAALLFGDIYSSQLERMRLAELVAGQIKKQAGQDALQVHINAAPAGAAPAGADQSAANSQPPGPAPAPAVPAAGVVAAAADPAGALAACEASEARLLVVLRQQVLSRLVAVQLALAKESVSWKRGVLATPPLVLNVLGAMNAVKEALTSQRLALAPFTRQGAAGMEQESGAAGAAGSSGGGMLHTMEHCYSLWALPLHRVWMQIMQTVRDLTAVTAAHLRRQPQGTAARAAARAQLAAQLQQLEAQRLELRHGWLELRIRLHRAVRDSQPWSGSKVAGGEEAGSFWPTDSVHLFTFTYGVSRCLNAFAAAAQAVANGLDD